MKTCIVADDSGVIRRVARRILEDLGFLVVEAEDGAKALDACRRSMPSFILVDSNMPVMDGMHFLTTLRREPGGLVPKIIFCTTENNRAQMMNAINAGADECLMKPFDRQILTSKLSDVQLI